MQTENNNTPERADTSTQPTTTTEADTPPAVTDSELQLLTMYRALPDAERQRAWNGVADAEARVRDPKLAASYPPIERFIDWLLSAVQGEHVENICFMQSLTKRQHKDYIKAYVILAGIHAAAEAQFLLVNGSDDSDDTDSTRESSISHGEATS